MTNHQKRVAIMGGTFDPIHMGHLVTAEAVRHEFQIDEVLFVPTGNPPHKSTVAITAAEHRYLMSVLATAGNEHFNVSRIEIDREGKTYTIDTIKELVKSYGKQAKLYFITGADAMHQILTWRHSEALLKLCTFVAVTRPGYNKEALLNKVAELRQTYDANICFLEVPALSISSSDIRRRIQEERPIKYLVSSAVENYITKQQLYKHPVSFTSDTIKQLTDYVKSCVSDKRYQHIRGVVEQALVLANKHGVDTDKAFIAALFHDVAKELGEASMQMYCERYHIGLDTFEQAHIDSAHGKVAAAILEHEWHVKDVSILNSIRYHTVGREHMDTLEKIIYLADMTERGRKPYPALEKIRRLSEADLDAAMYEALVSSEYYVREVLGEEVHPVTYTLLKTYQINE